MHISSLPAPFGIGDLGPEAFYFADFLFRSQQTYWQMLPLNPAGESEGFSPYSSSSSMAGNIYLISPEELAKEGLLTDEEVAGARLPLTEKADFKKAVEIKENLLWKAYKRYTSNDNAEQRLAFNSFYENNHYWLQDFSYYVLLKKINNRQAWSDWPDKYKQRDAGALEELEIKYKRDLEEIRWQQMIFDRQWHALKNYCSQLNLKVIGDLPFYVGRDSADVWANTDIFAIDKKGRMTSVAGVPPDAFNNDGQLWGMPVYNWHALKKQNYKWWITRLRKNLELFDTVRLDHFRALASYWAVPPDEKNARKGEWKKAPGKAFLKEVRKQLNGLPFIAEDLGEIGEDVFALRDAFDLPGMNVLQFAFGMDMPSNTYIPHHNIPNSIIYTGTHDNNTTRGWHSALSAIEKDNLNRYLGTIITEENVSMQLSRLAYGSVSSRAILPMQDILELDENARMNTPAGGGQNWAWRLDKKLLTPAVERKLTEWCNIFDRRRDGDTSYAAMK
jgi:4-alpha-glucanotransferase